MPVRSSHAIRRYLRACSIDDADVRPALDALGASGRVGDLADLYSLRADELKGATAASAQRFVAALTTHPPVPWASLCALLGVDAERTYVERTGLSDLAALAAEPDLRALAPELTAGEATRLEPHRALFARLAAARPQAVALPEVPAPELRAELERGAGEPLAAARVERFGGRAAELRALLGFELPDDFFALWELDGELASAAPGATLDAALGISFWGPFDVLAGRLDQRSLTGPFVAHGRSYMDPPEFVPVLFGDSDGEHWGYWLDDPAERPSWVVSYHNHDAYVPSVVGRTLFDAVRMALEFRWRDNQAYLEDEPDEPAYRERLDALRLLRERLMKYGTEQRPEHGQAYTDRYADASRLLRRRTTTAATLEGVGIVVPRQSYERPGCYGDELRERLSSADGIEAIHAEARAALARSRPGTALELGKALWVMGKQARTQANEVLIAAYRSLERPLLAIVAEAHRDTWDERVTDVIG